MISGGPIRTFTDIRDEDNPFEWIDGYQTGCRTRRRNAFSEEIGSRVLMTMRKCCMR